MHIIPYPSEALNKKTCRYGAFLDSMSQMSSAITFDQRSFADNLRNKIIETARGSNFWGPKPEGFDGYHHTNMRVFLENIPISDTAKMHWVEGLNIFYGVSLITENILAQNGKRDVLYQPELWRDYLAVTLDVLVERFNPMPRLRFDEPDEFNLG